MIVDMPKFIERESPYWRELEGMLDSLNGKRVLDLEEVERLHYLYDRAASSLTRLATFTSERRTYRYLEALVARAYGEVHTTTEPVGKVRAVFWFLTIFPQTFRRWRRAFHVSCLVTAVGMVFGGIALAVDAAAKPVLLPFEHLQGRPSERVRMEEEAGSTYDVMGNSKASFSAQLMTHNTKVSIMTMSSGVLYGLGTIVLLFYNGIILGAVCIDYILDGQIVFLLAWLMPHGVIEIPAILIAGQAGLVIGSAMVGWGSREPLGVRMRKIVPDAATLIGGVAVMLVWAGLIEACMSQYHAPVLPYSVKIFFGVVELVGLVYLLNWSGKQVVK